eukprot:g8203.t1
MDIYPRRASLEGWEVEMFKLVSSGATPEQWKEWLRVPLEHAAARGNLDLFNKLLGAGADGRAGWRGCRGRTLLDAAAIGGNVDIVSGLLRSGAHQEVNAMSFSRRPPLYLATISGNEAVAKQLVVAGANVNVDDPVDEWSVLHEAVRGGHAELVDCFLANRANPNWPECVGGATPLHVAADEGHDGIVSTLLLNGANKDALDKEGSTPVMGASVRGHAAVVKILLAAGADFNIRNNTGAYSALDLAAEEGHVPVIDAIVAHGADVNVCDGNGYTALHTAAEYDQSDAIDALIRAGADVDAKSDDGSTPLVIAAGRSQRNAILALLGHGATVDVRHEGGNTPLHSACSRRWEGVGAAVDLLLRWGGDETALNEEGRRPAEVLDEAAVDYDEYQECSEDEIERARRLLARAPADRAWRRRCWLVILRTRAPEARIEPNGDNNSGSANRDSSDAGGRSEAEDFDDDCRGAAVGSEGGAGGVSSDIAAFLVELGPEGVFRKVVSFL